MMDSRKKHVRRVASILCIISLSALNIETVNAATGSSSISGTVTDQATGLGIGGVCIGYYDSSVMAHAAETTTLTDGTFSIEGLLAGTYHLQADTTCDGTQQSIYVGKDFPTAYTVTAGVPIVNASLALITGASMSGTVTNAMNGVGVGLWCLEPVPNNENNPSVYQTTSASDGSYTLTGLPVGKYPLWIWASSTCRAGTSKEFAPQSWTVTVPSLSSKVHRDFQLTADMRAITFTSGRSVITTAASGVLTKFLANYVPTMLLYMTITGYARNNATLARSRAIATSNFLSRKVHLVAMFRVVTNAVTNAVTMTDIQFAAPNCKC